MSKWALAVAAAVVPVSMAWGTTFAQQAVAFDPTGTGFGMSFVDASPLRADGITGGGNDATIGLPRSGDVHGHDTAPALAITHPVSWAMMLVGFGAMGGLLRRKHRVTFG